MASKTQRIKLKFCSWPLRPGWLAPPISWSYFLPFFHSFHLRLYLCSASFCFLNLPCHSSDLPFACVFLVLSFPGQLLFILQDSALISPPLWSPPWFLRDGPGRCSSGFHCFVYLLFLEHFSGCVIIAHWLSYILYSYLLPFGSNFSPILQRKLKQICGTLTVLSKASRPPPSACIMFFFPPPCAGPHASPYFKGLFH